jgi:hypothetical protein
MQHKTCCYFKFVVAVKCIGMLLKHMISITQDITAQTDRHWTLMTVGGLKLIREYYQDLYLQSYNIFSHSNCIALPIESVHIEIKILPNLCVKNEKKCLCLFLLRPQCVIEFTSFFNSCCYARGDTKFTDQQLCK